jgi:hypothetical protein
VVTRVAIAIPTTINYLVDEFFPIGKIKNKKSKSIPSTTTFYKGIFFGNKIGPMSPNLEGKNFNCHISTIDSNLHFWQLKLNSQHVLHFQNFNTQLDLHYLSQKMERKVGCYGN